MDDQISRQTAIKIIKNYCENGCDIAEDNWCPSCQREQFIKLLEALPPAQPERKIFKEMSDTEFEKWLYEHGICNPDIHESIPCGIVPLLIDNAINELSAEPETCEGCKHLGKWENEVEYGYPSPCTRCKRRVEDSYER